MKDRKRLKRLILVRDRIKDARRSELVEASNKMNLAEAGVQQARALRSSAVESLVHAQDVLGHDLEDRARTVDLANKGIVQADSLLQDCIAVQEQCRDRMIAASLDVKTLEHVDTKLKQQETKDKKRKEQLDSDEASSRIRRGAA